MSSLVFLCVKLVLDALAISTALELYIFRLILIKMIF